ncbi:LysR family transcriptional regulator [Brevibacterium linens]|uniref:LysR family transcriptional regulator n=1 Tax=Brevibacterium linens TaxID=1703 RepID=UPI0027E27A9F|nr:LysR family transcriptional regulator [Brevibacterium linens]
MPKASVIYSFDAECVDGKKCVPFGCGRKNLYSYRMRVERARYFLAAVDTGSFRAAAERCQVSQPTLREQVTLLEEELNVVLLTRSKLGVRLTEAGRSIVPYCRRLTASEEAIHRMAAEVSGTFRGRVAIGSIAALAEVLIAPVASRLLQQHPDLRFEITEASSAEVESKVLNGALDIGIVSAPRTQPPHGITRSQVAEVGLGVVVPADHAFAEMRAIRWSNLESWPIVAMRPGTVIGQEIVSRLPDADVVVRAASARTVRVMVKNGAGIGVLAAVDFPSHDHALTWVPLLDTPPLEICLVHRTDSQPSASALVVRRFIQEQGAALVIA